MRALDSSVHSAPGRACLEACDMKGKHRPSLRNFLLSGQYPTVIYAHPCLVQEPVTLIIGHILLGTTSCCLKQWCTARENILSKIARQSLFKLIGTHMSPIIRISCWNNSAIFLLSTILYIFIYIMYLYSTFKLLQWHTLSYIKGKFVPHVRSSKWHRALRQGKPVERYLCIVVLPCIKGGPHYQSCVALWLNTNPSHPKLRVIRVIYLSDMVYSYSVTCYGPS